VTPQIPPALDAEVPDALQAVDSNPGADATVLEAATDSGSRPDVDASAPDVQADSGLDGDGSDAGPDAGLTDAAGECSVGDVCRPRVVTARLNGLGPLDVNGDGLTDVAVGAPSENRVYVYPGIRGPFPTTAQRTLTVMEVNSSLGEALSSAGDVNGDGFTDLVACSGSRPFGTPGPTAHVFLGGAGGVSTTPSTSLSPPEGGGFSFGSSATGVGDVNGDRYSDVIVCDRGNSGRGYLYVGTAGGLASTPRFTLSPPSGAFNFCSSVAPLGDTDEDGFAEFAVGASGGGVHLYAGSAGGLAPSPTQRITAPTGAGMNFGAQVANVGDVNGDGRADLAVAAIDTNSNAGTVYVYAGVRGGVAPAPMATLQAPDGRESFFGWAMTAVGDINGDGYGDLLVGASRFAVYTGRAYLFAGGAGGPGPTPMLVLRSPGGAQGDFGASLAGGGDFNGDGYPDFVIGASRLLAAFVYLGGPGGAPSMPTVRVSSMTAGMSNHSFGFTVATARRPLCARTPPA
jgi:hypothetical protein